MEAKKNSLKIILEIPKKEQKLFITFEGKYEGIQQFIFAIDGKILNIYSFQQS